MGLHEKESFKVGLVVERKRRRTLGIWYEQDMNEQSLDSVRSGHINTKKWKESPKSVSHFSGAYVSAPDAIQTLSDNRSARK